MMTRLWIVLIQLLRIHRNMLALKELPAAAEIALPVIIKEPESLLLSLTQMVQRKCPNIEIITINYHLLVHHKDNSIYTRNPSILYYKCASNQYNSHCCRPTHKSSNTIFTTMRQQCINLCLTTFSFILRNRSRSSSSSSGFNTW